MSVTKTFAGQTFNLPQNKEPKSSNWGLQVSNFLIRVADYAIPKTGGLNTLNADLDFGTTYGLVFKYAKSAATPISDSATAFLRLAYSDTFTWRNSANTGNLTLALASDRLQFGGSNLLLASDADSANTAGKLVIRDGSGNFAANTITAASFNGPITGNASTASKWLTARTITLGNDLTGSVPIDGSGDVTLNATIAPNSVALGTDTTGNYVATIAGTANQVTVSGSGSETAAVTLSLPQDIATTSSPSFVNVNLSTLSSFKLPTGATADRPGSPVAGQIRYNTDTSSYEGYSSGAWSALGGGGTLDRVTQASHGFVAGDVLYLNGSTYTKAIATAANTAEVVGMVSRVIDTNTFELTISGEVTGLSGLTAGEQYFLSATSAGTMSASEPTTLGYVSMPLGVASSTTSFYVDLKRGIVVGGVNARTQLSLSNNTTATIQNLSAYDAGKVSGWIYIDATTDYKFYFEAPFAKNGAGTDYNVSPRYTGDTPPTGFSISITSAGLLQYVMPNVTGFASAIINYALNVPAVGATFPLSISASNVLGNTTGAAVAAGYIGEVQPNSWSGVAGSASAYVNASSIVLTSGRWLISGKAYAGAAAGSTVALFISTVSSTTFPAGSEGASNYESGPASVASVYDSIARVGPLLVDVSATTTYYAKIKIGGTVSGTNAGFITAIRIA